tara:strand:- start:162 stop:971 length:810 start_codon:yes stop_codon:yes gene_type:complete
MIQESRFAGLFYPETRQLLEETIQTFFKSIPKRKKHTVKGVIMPHAGYKYSGSVAAESLFNTQHLNIKTAIIIGPSHQFSFFGSSALAKKEYQTPLGNSLIDLEKVDFLLKKGQFIINEPDAFNNEHSIEVILPFLFSLHPKTAIIPIVIGQYNNDVINELVRLLASICKQEETLVITSTDFSHFFPAKQAKTKDQKAIDLIKEQNINKLIAAHEQQAIQLCGFGPLLVMLYLLKAWNVNQIEHLKYAHSGEITGDPSSVVGYNSVIFY